MPPRYASTCPGFAARIRVDQRVELAGVADGRLARGTARPEARLSARRDRLGEDRAREARPRLDQLRELGRVDRVRVDAGAGELVHHHVRGDAGLVVRGETGVEPVASARDKRVARRRSRAPARAGGCASPAAPAPRRAPLDELRGRLDRHEVGLGEVAVVVRLLLRAPRREPSVAASKSYVCWTTSPPDSQTRDLPRDSASIPRRDEVERVHVLQLGARAVARLARLRTDTLASTRSVPFSISASEIPSSTIV